MPVHVNLVFIGFDGTGGHEFKLTRDTLSRWFGHLDYVVQHRHLDELVAQFESGHHDYSPVARSLGYRYHFNVISLSPRVGQAIEGVLAHYLRPLNATLKFASGATAGRSQRAAYGVDAHAMSAALHSLTSHLARASTAARAYTLFVINPDTRRVLRGVGAPSAVVYGYTDGFTAAELDAVLHHVARVDAPPALRSLRLNHDPWEGVDLHDSAGKPTAPLRAAHLEHPSHRHDAVVLAGSGGARWAGIKGAAVMEGEAAEGGEDGAGAGAGSDVGDAGVHPRHVVQAADGGRAVRWTGMEAESEAWARQVQGALENAPSATDHVAAAVEVLERGTAEEKRALIVALRERQREQRGRQKPGSAVGSLVDTWVSQHRFAWIDLGAGPFQWGPVVGGNGVRDLHTLPAVPSPTESAASALSPRDEATINARARRLLSEQRMLQELAAMACEDSPDGDAAYCRSLGGRLERVRGAIASYKALLKAVLARESEAALQALLRVAREREEAAVGELSPLTSGGFTFQPSGSLEEDTFMATLGAAISKFLHQVVTPPSAFPAPLLPTPPPPTLLDFHAHKHAVEGAATLPVGAALFTTHEPLPANRVSQPSVITYDVHVVACQATYDPLDAAHGGFDLPAFKRELLRLRLPGQEVQISVKKVTLEDDPALATAFATALRTAVVPTLDARGQFVAAQRRYLDAVYLHHHLVELSGRHWDAPGVGPGAGSSTRYVPVFLFSVDSDSPLLLDKYHSARAVGGMALVVQSDFPAFPSPFHCNGEVSTWNLRNPLRPALTAVAAVAKGLPRTHLAWEDSAHMDMTQDWAWSVGHSPMSLTSAATSFSEFHLDAAHRNEIARALQASLALSNAAADALRGTAAALASRDEPELQPDRRRALVAQARAAADAHRSAAAKWQQASEALRTLDFGAAAVAAADSTPLAAGAYDTARRLAEELLSKHCASETATPAAAADGGTLPSAVVDTLHAAAAAPLSAFVVAAALSVVLAVVCGAIPWPSSSLRSKPKIN